MLLIRMRKKVKGWLNYRKNSQKEILRAKAIQSGTNLGLDREELNNYSGPDELKRIAQKFKAAENLTLINGKLPLIWWVNTDNFGDLLSPWLVGRLTDKEVMYGGDVDNSYVGIGSILRYVNKNSMVWGTGSFGPEPKGQVKISAKYLCVRGPLTRSKILDFGGVCPRNYGDPALALPLYYWPNVEKKYKYGLVIRWSEIRWRNLEPPENVKIIDLSTNDIRTTIKDILSCQKLASSSLHGLIIADAYGIPNAWLMAEEDLGGSRPKGGEYKFYDYFASVDKMRNSQLLEVKDHIPKVEKLNYDSRGIVFDFEAFLDSCPFLQRR